MFDREDEAPLVSLQDDDCDAPVTSQGTPHAKQKRLLELMEEMASPRLTTDAKRQKVDNLATQNWQAVVDHSIENVERDILNVLKKHVINNQIIHRWLEQFVKREASLIEHEYEKSMLPVFEKARNEAISFLRDKQQLEEDLGMTADELLLRAKSYDEMNKKNDDLTHVVRSKEIEIQKLQETLTAQQVLYENVKERVRKFQTMMAEI